MQYKPIQANIIQVKDETKQDNYSIQLYGPLYMYVAQNIRSSREFRSISRAELCLISVYTPLSYSKADLHEYRIADKCVQKYSILQTRNTITYHVFTNQNNSGLTLYNHLFNDPGKTVFLYIEYVYSPVVYQKYLTRLRELIIFEPWRENYHFSQPS